MKKIIEGSNAISQIVSLCQPAVVSAYPITPQTHIVEDLAKLKADGKAKYEYLRADSEFAAASIVAGASAAGVRTYTATCSQGVLLMTEVLFAIAGLRLPVVLTCANRAISAPISIWNDHQDIMVIRDSGWILLFAETNQEAIDLHMLAFKVAEKTRLPVAVNMDGFTLTHTFEPVDIPKATTVNKYLPKYKPLTKTYLNPAEPVSLGCFATPEHYQEIREQLQNDLISSQAVISKEMANLKKLFKRKLSLLEKYRANDAEIVFVAMGSVVGTVKEGVDSLRSAGIKAGLVKLALLRPFPAKELQSALKSAKYVAVIDKSISLGKEGVIATEIRSVLKECGKIKKIQSFIAGLGGKDFKKEHLKVIVKMLKSQNNKPFFIA